MMLSDAHLRLNVTRTIGNVSNNSSYLASGQLPLNCSDESMLAFYGRAFWSLKLWSPQATQVLHLSLHVCVKTCQAMPSCRACLDQPRVHFLGDCPQKTLHFLEIHPFEQEQYFCCGRNKRHGSIQLLFSARISRSAPALALEIVMLMGRKTQLNVCNSPRTKGAHFPKQMLR